MVLMTTQDFYWNRVAAVKTFAHPIDLRRVEKLMSREAVILDYGCGYGRTCAELFHAGYSHVMGVDTMEKGRFIKPDCRKLYHVAADPISALEYIASYKPHAVDAKWFSPAPAGGMRTK